MSATDAARSFSDLLDAVEHDSQDFAIVRRGKVVARLSPPLHGQGLKVKALLNATTPDLEWPRDLKKVRDLLSVEERE